MVAKYKIKDSHVGHLSRASKVKNDEYYTQYKDIEKFMYDFLVSGYFKDKKIILPCDQPQYSNFYKYFKDNFETLGLIELCATFYNPDEKSYKTSYNGIEESYSPLAGNGDFLSEEIKELILSYDVLVTNPPFSLTPLFNEFLFNSGLDFILIEALTSIAKNSFKNHINDFYLKSQALKFFTDYDSDVLNSGVPIVWVTNIKNVKNKPIFGVKPLSQKVINVTYKGAPIHNISRLDYFDDKHFGSGDIVAFPITALTYEFEGYEFLAFSNYTDFKEDLVKINTFNDDKYNGKELYIQLDDETIKALFARAIYRKL